MAFAGDANFNIGTDKYALFMTILLLGCANIHQILKYYYENQSMNIHLGEGGGDEECGDVR